MEDTPQSVENCVGQSGLAGWFWFGCGVWPPFFNSPTGRARDFSRRGRARADHHVGQSEQRVGLMPVLGQSAIAHFPVAENVLEDVEGMFDGRPDGGFGFLQRLERFFHRAFGHRFELAALAGDLPVNRPLQCHDLRALLDPGVAGVGVDLLLLAVQQFRRLCDVRDVGRSDDHGMHQPAVPIRTDVRFHSEIPLVAFAGLVHLRVALLCLVLGGGRCGDQRGVHQRPFAQQQAAARSGRR